MIVESIQSKQASSEAIVTVTDGVIMCKCFCQPCELTDGSFIPGPLFGFGASDIRRLDTILGCLEQKAGLSINVCGMVLSITPAIVAVGGIRIEPDAELPKDVRIGEFVEFTCQRVDILD